MAKATTTTTGAVEVTQKPGELAPAPDFIPRSREGTEGFTKDDLILPRVLIAQSMSPQMKRAEGKYLEGLLEGNLFNDLTEKIYGDGPILFAVVRKDPPKWIEFDPKQRGVVLNFNVPAGDPRTTFTTDAEGQNVKPRATQFYDYVIALLPLTDDDPMSQIAVLSMSGFNATRKGAARKLNTLINQRQRPLYSGTYELRSAMETNPKGTFGVFTIKNAGWVDQPTLEALKGIFEGIKDKSIAINREPGSDDGDDMDAAGKEQFAKDM